MTTTLDPIIIVCMFANCRANPQNFYIALYQKYMLITRTPKTAQLKQQLTFNPLVLIQQNITT
eukprot:403335609